MCPMIFKNIQPAWTGAVQDRAEIPLVTPREVEKEIKKHQPKDLI